MALTDEQREKILDAINPAYNNPTLKFEVEVAGDEVSDQPPSIGRNDIYEEGMEEALESLERNPPRPFDLTRLVNVYQAKIEFVELELRGAKIHQHRIQLPDDLKALLANDKEAQRRINATFQVIDGESEVSGDSLDQQIKEIRKTYLSPLKNIGTVLLKEHRESFENDLETFKAEIEVFKKTLQDKIQAEIQKNVTSLSDVFAKLISEQKPKTLIFKVSGELTLEKARKIAEDLLLRQIPSVEKLADNIELRCLYKDVTIEMLRNKEFQAQVRGAFPHVGWELPYDESQAAPVQQNLF